MPERHHYVPQLILRNFASDSKIWLFDKHKLKRFQTSVKNAFVEGDYNTVVADGFTLEAEQIFTRAEARIAPVLKSILDNGSVKQLSNDDKVQLAIFVTLQHLRTKQSRRTFTLFREHVRKRFPESPDLDFQVPYLNLDESDKYASLDFIVKNLSELSHALVEKDLVLIEKNCPGQFWVSDHPVILHNDAPDDAWSRRGLRVPGIQIYMPISSSYVIGFFCPTLAQELEDGIAKIDSAKSRAFARWFGTGNVGEIERLTLTDITYRKGKVERVLRAIRDDKKISFNKQNLIFLNSRQVVAAYRFLGSQKADFELAIDMLREDPSLRVTDHIRFG